MIQSYINEDLIVVYITVPTLEKARRIATSLIEKKLAACVSIIPNIISVYSFKGTKEEYEEEQLQVKTRSSLFNEVLEEIKKIHPLSLPEFFSVKIDQASPEYAAWLNQEIDSNVVKS